MKNPWLKIPLADLEGHMALPYVAQAQLLSDVFAGSLEEFAPKSVAVIGCVGGNGFDRINPQITGRVIGVDINPEYIREARARFKDRLPGLELITGDIQADEFAFAPVEMIFAGLLFEFVDVGITLARIHPMLDVGGKLVTVVQLPSATIPEISPSPFTSLCALSGIMHLVSPERLGRLAEEHGFKELDARVVESAGGKLFQVQTFGL